MEIKRDFNIPIYLVDEIIEYIEYAKAKGCNVQGTEDFSVERINVLK